MKHNGKWLICLVLVLAMCLAMPSAFSDSAEQNGNETNAESAASDKIDPRNCGDKERMKVSVTVLSGYTQPDSVEEKRLEDRYNIDIELIVLPGWTDGPTKLDTLMASGDTPTVIWWGWDATKQYQQWKNAGLLVDVSEYINKYTNMRDYYNKMNPMTLFYDTEEDGSMYRMPAAVAEPSCETLWIRQDWLNNLNMEIPTTIEELNEVLRAFTEDDPDGNGVNDTYGLGGHGENFNTVWPWIQSYDYTDATRWVVTEDGTVGYGPAMENTKKWLADVAELYAKGWIKPNIIQANDRDQEMVNGGFGVTYSWCTWNNADNAIMKAFYETHPDAKWVPIDMVKGENGNPQNASSTAAAWAKFAFTSSCTDPERLFAIWDDMASDEVYIERIFGIEGEDYTFDDNGDYVAIHNPEGDDNTALNLGLNMFYAIFYRTDEAQLSKTKSTLELFDRSIATSRDRFGQLVEWQDSTKLTNWMEVSTDISDEANRYMWAVIAGEDSIDNWDNYIATLNSLGLQEAVEEAQTVYDEQSKRVDAYMASLN